MGPHEGPNDFEVRPIGFVIDLARDVPHVELRYYAINHLRRELILSPASTLRLFFSTGPILDPVPIVQEFRVGPKSSLLVVYRRNLLDSEARGFGQQKGQYPLTASFSMTARAKSWRREYVYGPVTSMWIEGWISKPSAA
jgi:hypothetical protein